MRLTSALAVIAGSVAAMTATALPAEADSGYRYWSYYHQTEDGWEYSQVRMDTHVPDDGALEAWRFVAAEFGDVTRTPRIDLAFDDVCGGTERSDGRKRVALVLDYGRAADAADGTEPPQPRAECAVVDQDATTAMALSSVAELRLEDDSLCGIDGYPADGCNAAVDPLPDAATEPDDALRINDLAGLGDTAEEGADSSAESEDDGGSDVAVWVAVGVVLAAGVGAGPVAKRRRRRE